jgi:hypothetical protein
MGVETTFPFVLFLLIFFIEFWFDLACFEQSPPVFSSGRSLGPAAFVARNGPLDRFVRRR